jgi:uncharacterized membrane protein YfcA
VAVLIDARTGVIAMSLVGPILSGLQVLHYRRSLRLDPSLRGLVAAALVGSLVGAQILIVMPGAAIALALSLFTLWFAISSARGERPPLAVGRQRWLAPGAGFVGGLSTGSLGASGPVFGSYLTAIGLRGTEFAMTISVVFFITAMPRVVWLAAQGEYTPELLGIAAMLAVPAIVFQRVGLRLRGRFSREALYRAVIITLFVAGTNLFVRTVVGLLS